jgi:cytochrome P450
MLSRMASGAASLSDDGWGGCNPLDPEFRDDPYPRLARLREVEPVNVTPIGIVRLLRYADCVKLFKDVRTGVRTTDGSLPGADETRMEGQRRFMLQQDPPNHTRLRRLVSKAFSPRALRALEERIDAVVDECLDAVAARGEMDVIADLALPVPATIICEMMGVPVKDRDKFTTWTAEATFGLAAQILPPEMIARAEAAGLSLAEYFQELIEERRRRQTDDILGALVRAEAEGDRLSTEELLSQAVGLLIAGFETTIGLIGNGVRQLLLHPDELAKLRARPDLIESAVNECLRFDGPIPLTQRILHEEAEFGGRTFPPNTILFAMIASADRDPERFPDPDRFDVERRDNDHLAFGGGAHFCLGAHLAELEGRAAIGKLVQRFEDLALVSKERVPGPSLFRVPGRLDVTFRPSP